MASGQERILRRRIKSVQSTKKITRAMELIAASRIVKAQQRVAAARPYSEQITEVIRNLAAAGAGFDHPLLAEREVRTSGHVVLTADRREAGAVDRVDLTYTRFLSMGSQRVVTSQLLPLEAKALKEGRSAGPQADYEYEPEPTQILERLLPRYVEARVFAALLDAAASE